MSDIYTQEIRALHNARLASKISLKAWENHSLIHDKLANIMVELGWADREMSTFCTPEWARKISKEKEEMFALYVRICQEEVEAMEEWVVAEEAEENAWMHWSKLRELCNQDRIEKTFLYKDKEK